MNKIRFKDGTEYQVKDGASINNIHLLIPSGEFEEVILIITKTENLNTVEFLCDNVVTGEYSDMILVDPVGKIEKTDDNLYIVLNLREKTDIEKRLDAIENTQVIQDGAIVDLAVVVGEVAEGGGES